jgi:hypothetical protein
VWFMGHSYIKVKSVALSPLPPNDIYLSGGRYPKNADKQFLLCLLLLIITMLYRQTGVAYK